MQIRLTQLLQNNNVTGSDVMVTDVSGPLSYITKQTTVDKLAKYITGSIKDLYLSSVSANLAQFATMSVSVVSSSLIPSADSVWDLGSADRQWRDLHLSGTTIYLGGKQISVVNDSITIDGDPIVVNTTASASIIANVKTENLEAKTISTNIFKITGNYDLSVDPDKHVIFAYAGNGEITASVPLAASVPSRQYIFKKIDSTLNGVTIHSPFETIDGTTTKELLVQYETLTIISDGTGSWFVL